MLEVFGKLGSIQFDPLGVAGRSHDLVSHARVDAYDPYWCDELYERREITDRLRRRQPSSTHGSRRPTSARIHRPIGQRHVRMAA